jgi:Zn-dependent M16 (insulinase) family peptidase
MHTLIDPRNTLLNEGDSIGGYRICRVRSLELINSIFYELEHEKTKARHVHISTDDTENTFSVAFKTVPEDSTGVAHILEHTVLCGSRSFPVRDPFFSMLKRSLSTFMNAFTSSDWTMYPFSTQNKKDFYNLLDVYLDAAFFPNLDSLSFKQEGHRLEVEPGSGGKGAPKLTYKGVVYNEMKGAMSSPSEVMARSLLKSLYPSTTYHFNSGGEPAVIPQLTHEQLKAFHRRHYHPSNAYFYTYGNLPLKDHLDFIDEKILRHFDTIDPKTEVPSQVRWKEPKYDTYYYYLNNNEDPTKKCQVCLAWLTADIKDSFEVLVLTLLEQILLGNSASPLHKALIDSKLGTALSDSTGFDANNRDTLFSAGLKDVKESDADTIEEIVFNVLGHLADDGIDRKLIDSAIHQLEFHRKEITNYPFPYGIKLLVTFCGSWVHGGDPVRILNFDEDMTALKDVVSREPFFENRIKTYFLDNPHRVRLTLMPDQEMAVKEEMRVTRELDVLQKDMTEFDFAEIRKDTDALKKLQEKVEDVSVLPTLERENIPPQVKSIPETVMKEPVPAACYQQPTAGIFYFSAAAGSGNLPQRLIPLVPFFCHAFTKIGTTRRDYTDMVQLIDAYTGGIELSTQARNQFDGEGSCLPFVTFNGKCLARNQERMFAIISELLCSFDFSDLTRLKSLLLEYRAGMETMVIHNGHQLAMSLASRNFSTTMALAEMWHGIHQLKMIKDLTTNITEDQLETLSADLKLIGTTMLTSSNCKMALIGEEQQLATALPLVSSLQNNLLPENGNGFKPPHIEKNEGIPREGWSTASAVSFVAQTFPVVRMEHEDSPALAVISKILRSMYLHREIREKGGAYGGFAVYNPESGLLGFGSYRDPHIIETLNAYKGAAVFIKSDDYGDQDIKEAIFQVCSEIDKPDPPGLAARKAFYRTIMSLSDESRNRFKQRLLSLARDQVNQAAEKYFDQTGAGQAVAVISSEEKLKAANEIFGKNPLTLHRI